jgi:hypothetical protein
MSEAIIETMETAQPEAAEPVKPYIFRTLGGGDVFLMFRIIGKIGVKEFNACFEHDGIKHLVAAMMGEKLAKAKEDEEETSVSVTYISVVLEVADVIFRNLPKCEDEIFQMLSQTSNLSVAQVKKLNLAHFTEMVIDFIKKEEFRDFIKVVSKLFK